MLRLRVLLLVLVTAAPARAQMDWLGPHLDSHRWNRPREHQMRGQSSGERQAPDRASGGSRARQSADVSEQQSLRVIPEAAPPRQP